jgi:hypothetical protein
MKTATVILYTLLLEVALQKEHILLSFCTNKIENHFLKPYAYLQKNV